MIYLIFAIASSALISIVMRASEKQVQNTMGMFMANYAMCLVLSRLFMGETRLFTGEEGIGFAVSLGLFNGVLYLAGFVLMQRSMHYNGAMLSSAFMKLGVLVPTVMAIVVFRERPQFTQVLGIIAAVAAVVLINFEKEGTTAGNKKSMLVILLLVSGFTDSLANVYDKTGSAGLKDHFLFYTFIAALILAFVLAVKGRGKICVKDILFGILIGIPNYFSARFLLLALGSVPAVVTYPVYSVGTIIVVSVVSMLVWKERISRQKKLALGIVLLSLILLNI